MDDGHGACVCRVKYLDGIFGDVFHGILARPAISLAKRSSRWTMCSSVPAIASLLRVSDVSEKIIGFA